MSSYPTASARRTAVSVTIDGADITSALAPYILSLSYTDNEEGESDDLQITLQDREDIWLLNWITSLVEGSAETPSTTTAESDTAWAIGQSVVANGKPQYSSYGTGKPGNSVSDHHGKITHLNLKPGIPYPIHVDYLGWFAESEVTQEGETTSEASSVPAVKIKATITQQNWTGDNSRLSLPCGTFELDSIEANGPPQQVTIKATALPFSSQIRQTKKSRAWEAYTLKGIASEMAKANGMECLYESTADPSYDRVEQYKCSDIAFLSQLCQNAGTSLKVTNNTLVLFDQIAYEQKDAVLTITKGDGSYTKYKLTIGEADTEYASCRVSYVDPSSGQTIEATAKVEDYDADAKNNQQLEITAKVSSIADAQSMAASQLRRHNKFAKTATFTLKGNANVVAGVTVKLAGFGAWNAKYLVYQAKHTVGTSGYTTQIKLRQVLEGY